MSRNPLIMFGFFLFFIAASIAVPNIDTMFLNLSSWNSDTQVLVQFAFTAIGFGFLFKVVYTNA